MLVQEKIGMRVTSNFRNSIVLLLYFSKMKKGSEIVICLQGNIPSISQQEQRSSSMVCVEIV